MKPFRSVVIIEEDVTAEWREAVSKWLVESGCLYMMAWGKDCSYWDDSVDHASLEGFNYGEVPEDKFVMTTWHENEPLEDVFFFSKNNGFHPTVELENTLLLHISGTNKGNQFINGYAGA